VQGGEEKQLNILKLCTNDIPLVVLIRRSKADCPAKGQTQFYLDRFTNHFFFQHTVCHILNSGVSNPSEMLATEVIP